MAPGDETGNLLSYRDISLRMGIREATLRNYRRRGYMPPPDVMLADRPRWRETSIERWERLRSIAANERRIP
jgi:predicted site-specific integrase-resolvase